MKTKNKTRIEKLERDLDLQDKMTRMHRADSIAFQNLGMILSILLIASLIYGVIESNENRILKEKIEELCTSDTSR